jgi:hypothetical protein
MARLLKMKKFEKILRKHIEAVRDNTNLTTFDTTDTGSGAPSNPCHIGGKPDMKKVCDAVTELRRSPGNYSGSNQCAKYIQSNNTDNCKDRGYLKFSNVKLACERYKRSVEAVLPAGSTANQIAEAGRKAMCDCINFVRYGEPKTLSGNSTISDGINTTVGPREFVEQMRSAFGSGCNYIHLAAICDESKKTDDFARRQDLMC